MILAFPSRYSSWSTPALEAELERLALQPAMRSGPQEFRIAAIAEELERRAWREAKAA